MKKVGINMKINSENICQLLGITSIDYDERINNLIPQLLDSICKYCRNDFLLRGKSGVVYENLDMTIDETTITLTTTLPIKQYDFIRIYNTDYNDGLYQISSYETGIITIDTSKEMVDESTTGIIALVKFPSEFISLIAGYIKTNIIDVETSNNVKIEEIDDTKVEYFKPNNFDYDTFVKNNQNSLNKYRQVFSDCNFGDVV